MHICEWCGANYVYRTGKSRHKKICEQRPKIKIDIKRKIIDPNNILLEAIAKLEEKVDKIQASPIVNNNYNNWIIVGGDIFQMMIDKIGKKEAITMLLESTTTDIARKIYFEGILPEEYPIACKDNLHFRFLNDKYEVVDDRGGLKVNNIVLNNVRDAMIHAVNEKITDQVRGEDGSDLNNLQSKLIGAYNEDIKPELSKLSYNPAHPFFQTLI